MANKFKQNKYRPLKLNELKKFITAKKNLNSPNKEFNMVNI